MDCFYSNNKKKHTANVMKIEDKHKTNYLKFKFIVPLKIFSILFLLNIHTLSSYALRFTLYKI